MFAVIPRNRHISIAFYDVRGNIYGGPILILNPRIPTWAYNTETMKWNDFFVMLRMYVLVVITPYETYQYLTSFLYVHNRQELLIFEHILLKKSLESLTI